MSPEIEFDETLANIEILISLIKRDISFCQRERRLILERLYVIRHPERLSQGEVSAGD